MCVSSITIEKWFKNNLLKGMIRMNILTDGFNINQWTQMIIDAADSRQANNTHKNICRVIYPDGKRTLELKTDEEIDAHYKTHGSWNAACGKMSLKDVVNITRICLLENPPSSILKNKIKNSLSVFALRAEEHYKNGFIGALRKAFSVFFNLFITDSVVLTITKNTKIDVKIANFQNQNKLPMFIGNSAEFIHLVNK